jgi:hypothetical protein
MQTAFFLDGEQREPAHECPGKEANPNGTRDVIIIIDLDPLHPRGRRFTLKNKTAEFLVCQLLNPFPCPGDHPFGMIDPAPAGHKTRGLRITDQAQGLPGDSHTSFHFRTDRNKVKKISESSGNVSVVFVDSVKSNLVAQQTGTYTDSYLFFFVVFHCLSPVL